MPFGVRNSLDDILRRMGVGSFETKDGQMISHEMLPPEVQKRMTPYAAGRDLSNMAGNEPETDKWMGANQQVINRLYDPATRDAMMAQTVGGRYAPDAVQDFDQAQGMDQMMNEITNALAKRKIRATRGR